MGKKVNWLTNTNRKMGKKVLTFSLPPIGTCTPSPWCREKCYGQQGNYRFNNVQDSLAKRFPITMQDNFVEIISDEIKRKKLPYVRIHVVGDFYSEKYIGKWIEIIKDNPEVMFRSTTHRIDMQDSLLELAALDNMVLRESLDPSRKVPTLGLPFAAISEIEGLDYSKSHLCEQWCDDCGYFCWKSSSSIHFAERKN